MKKYLGINCCLSFFLQKMAILRKKHKLSAHNKENFLEHPRSNLARNLNLSKSQKDYITQVSEVTEVRVTSKLSQEFSWTESSTLSALSWLDEFLLSPLIQGDSRTTPETSWITLGTNQATNENDSQCDPHIEASPFQKQNKRSSGQHDECDTYRWSRDHAIPPSRNAILTQSEDQIVIYHRIA